MTPGLKTVLPLQIAKSIPRFIEDILSMVLKYRGPLPAVNDQNKRHRGKQTIRCTLHYQISELMKKPPSELFALSGEKDRKHIAGFIFQPIICKRENIACELGIRIYSRDPFGSIIQHADLDNRLKTLFDALRPPTEAELPKDEKPKNGENFFWILLEDDSLIADLYVTTHRLLIPIAENENPSDIELDIEFKVKYADFL